MARRVRERNYTQRGGSGILKTVVIAVLATSIGALIIGLYITPALGNTYLIVNLDYKGNPVSGRVTVAAMTGQAQGFSYSGNGSSVKFYLHDGFYDVSASYTNSTGSLINTRYWVIDLTNANAFSWHYMTIYLDSDNASY
jgi:hypothetical protein